MKPIPRAGEVAQALKASEAVVKDAIRQLNRTAGTLMAKGDYSGAEALALRGRKMLEFQARVNELRRTWREIRRGATGNVAEPKTPLWVYYHPILKALVEAGGSARRSELEPAVRVILGNELQPGDETPMARGRTRWQVMIQRARKYMVNEGWLETGTGSRWRITEEGRRVAKEGNAQQRKAMGNHEGSRATHDVKGP